jgi:hypothetical protein
MKIKNYSQIISVFIAVSLSICLFLSTLQYHDKIETAATLQCSLVNQTVAFIKTKVIYPYLSAFIEIKNFAKDTPPVYPKKSVPLKQRKPIKIFQQLYYILGAVLATNRMIFWFLLIMAVWIWLGTKKKVSAEVSHCSTWIRGVADFLTPRDKYLKYLINQYDIEDILKKYKINNPHFGCMIRNAGFLFIPGNHVFLPPFIKGDIGGFLKTSLFNNKIYKKRY